MNNKLKLLIIAVIAALGVGGYVGFLTDDQCEEAEVQILVVDEANDSEDVYWCGTEEEAAEYRTALADNLDSVTRCDEYEEVEIPQYEECEEEDEECTPFDEEAYIAADLASQDQACYEAKMNAYIAWIKEDEQFYSIMNPILYQKIDNIELIPMQFAAVREHPEYAQALEQVFIDKYDAENNEFDGTLVFQGVILSEVANQKVQRLMGDDDYFDFSSLEGEDFTAKIFNLLTL